MNHTTLKVEDSQFWDFDYDEMGKYDLPAEIDYIINITGQSKITYVGHSMGGTQMITGLSMNPEYFSEKINLFVGLGAASRLKYTKSNYVQNVARFFVLFKSIIVDTFHIYQFVAPDFLKSIVTSELYNLFPELFLNDMSVFEGDPTQLDLKRSEVYITHFPSGAGWRCFLHFSQSIGKENFSRYDYSSPT